LKAVNQWYNKENARLQSIRDRQRKDRRRTKRQQILLRDRNNKVNDYMSKAARRIIDDCLKNDIGRLVVGYQETFQRSADMGKANNQSFTSIPYGKLIHKLEYLCERYGLEFVKQEESYTSKASFWEKDEIPVYEEGKRKEYRFSGKRTYRGMYETGNGRKINADVNGALNILRKSRVVSLEGLYSRGEVDTPVRIRIA
ncbi:MAG: RNA-guided endonuclease TnpB family protein, partial [Eubacterium sp.]|nr:RNA-guided endonuclease TnpB family protein [Eubacterium sp.]